MSVKIRLTKLGKKNAPAYRIVAMNTRSKRDGKALDILGHYNPSVNPAQLEINQEKMTAWTNKGAQVTDAVKKLNEGSYKFKKYNPKGDSASEGEASAETTKAEAETAKPAEAAAE